MVAGDNGVASSVNTSASDTSTMARDTGRDTGGSTRSVVLADALSAADGGFMLLLVATGLNAGCESQQGNGWCGEVHFYGK
jgi:hypothetical protein